MGVDSDRCVTLAFVDPSPMGGGYSPSNNVPMTNGPIGQSSPYLGRRQIDTREANYFGYQGNRQYSG